MEQELRKELKRKQDGDEFDMVQELPEEEVF